jgi:hypothetical protein
VAGILGRHPGAAPETFTTPVNAPMMTKATDPTVLVGNRGHGLVVTPRPPVQPVTVADMIAKAKSKGITKTPDEVRADLKNDPRFKLVD